jgi:hypothetical protein
LVLGTIYGVTKALSAVTKRQKNHENHSSSTDV